MTVQRPVPGCCSSYIDCMRDPEIRASLCQELMAIHAQDPDTLLRQELGLCLGEARVDVAVVNGSLSGFEIKSARDTLERLPKQVELYGRVLDFASIVTCDRYAERVHGYLPSWWGMVLAHPQPSGVALLHVRAPKQNPSVDPYSLAQLLWRDEAFDVLRRHSLHVGLAKATRFRLWEAMAEGMPLGQIQAEVRLRLKARQDWPGGQR